MISLRADGAIVQAEDVELIRSREVKYWLVFKQFLLR